MTTVSHANSPAAAADDQFDSLYAEHFDFLVAVAVRKFRVPQDEAEMLTQEVFLKYLRVSGEVDNAHSWMLAAICQASRNYWRQHGRNVETLDDEALAKPDPATVHILDVKSDELTAKRILNALAPRDQEILRMRYLEGASIMKIAAHLGVKPKYAQKLLTKI